MHNHPDVALDAPCSPAVTKRFGAGEIDTLPDAEVTAIPVVAPIAIPLLPALIVSVEVAVVFVDMRAIPLGLEITDTSPTPWPPLPVTETFKP